MRPDWIPVLTMMMVSLISYIDRNTLALLAPAMLEELQLSGEQYGWAVSGFSIAYMGSNLLWGRWMDKHGLRWAMLAAVLFWSLASASHAAVVGFASLAVARVALGFGEGATFPGGLRAAVQSLPPSHRARGTAIAYSGGSLGAVITPLLIMPVYRVYGWRVAFLFTGLAGLVWLLLWLWVWRRPSLRPDSPDTMTKSAVPGWSDHRLWSFVLIYAFGALPLGFVLYFAALYLRTLGLDQISIGNLLWIPPLGWEAGYFFWGWWTDRARGHFRAELALLTALSLPLAFTPWINGLEWILALMFFSTFVTAGFIISGVAFGTREFGAGNAGFVAGVGAGSWSLLVAVTMPVFGRLFDLQLYGMAFGLACLFPVCGFAGWLALRNSTK